ncbi:hypothetical protein ACKXF6_12790, partial [Faecalibacterium taiwanense]|uniref:hypothetical protein n=1 Tax=Faecalibacterium taiwanense TaxID=3030638 RepID=UPI003AAC7981
NYCNAFCFTSQPSAQPQSKFSQLHNISRDILVKVPNIFKLLFYLQQIKRIFRIFIRLYICRFTNIYKNTKGIIMEIVWLNTEVDAIHYVYDYAVPNTIDLILLKNSFGAARRNLA